MIDSFVLWVEKQELSSACAHRSNSSGCYGRVQLGCYGRSFDVCCHKMATSKKTGNSEADNQSTTSTECPFIKVATEAFLVFDATNNETVDVREIGTIIRSLGKPFFV